MIITIQHPRNSPHNLRQESPLLINIVSPAENPNTLLTKPILNLGLRHLILP